MLKNPDYAAARDLLLSAVKPVGTEQIPLCDCGGRILARDLEAAENIPPFDRSPYDGYAFRAEDTAGACKENPVTLRVLEELPAGAVPTKTVTAGTAVRLMTGAPIPPGADAVCMYEVTEFTPETVTLFKPSQPGDNIVRTGEDVRRGDVLARQGQVIDPGVAGTLASQGVARPLVYRRPRIGILSTGSELSEPEETPGPGKIRNSNRATLEAAVRAIGCESLWLGTAGDDAEEIAALFRRGLECCDAILSTGGVSVGDFDLTPEAMVLTGAEMLFRGVDMKPGMACAYALCAGKLLGGLSGNPASALTNFYAVALPALKKLAGYAQPCPREITVTLAAPFRKKSPKTRLLRGTLDLSDGTARMWLPADQGNVVLSSAIGCDVMAIVEAGSGKLDAGTTLKGFLL